MADLKRNCPSEAYISCPKCAKRGKSRTIKSHVAVDHGCEVDYHCILPKADGSLCNWSCGMKIGCFNSHQRIMHGINFSDGAKHIYTTATGFVLKDSVTFGVKEHTVMCLAGSEAQSKLVMKEGRTRYRLHKGVGGMEIVDFQNVDKLEIGGKWYMQGGLREIVLRHDGVYVCELAGKLKRKRMSKPKSPAKKLKVHEEITHTVSAVAPSTVVYEGDVSVFTEHIEDVDLPVILVDEQAHAVVSDEEESIHTDVVNEEESIHSDVVNEEESIHAEVVNEGLGNTDCENDSGDEFVDFDYDADSDDEGNESDDSVIEIESDEEEEVSDGDNEEDSEDDVSIIEVESDEEGEVSSGEPEDEEVSVGEPEVDSEDEDNDMQEAFKASGGMVDVSDDSEDEEEGQEFYPVDPQVEEQGRGTDDSDFRFEKLVASVNERGESLEWAMQRIGVKYGKTLTPGVGEAICLKVMNELTQIPDAEHALLLMKWKIEQLAKQRKAWKKIN